eukprot:1076646-Prorocentrum_minimum.AAC.2
MLGSVGERLGRVVAAEESVRSRRRTEYVSFELNKVYNPTWDEFFQAPRVAGLFVDLDPEVKNSKILHQYKGVGSDRRIVFTWWDILEYGLDEENTFQIALYLQTGVIQLSYGTVSAVSGVVGLSPGGGVPAGWSDASSTMFSNIKNPNTFAPTTAPTVTTGAPTVTTGAPT